MSIKKFQIFDIKSHKDLVKGDALFQTEKHKRKCWVLIPFTKKKSKPNVVLTFEGRQYTLPVDTFDLLVQFGLNKVQREVNPYDG